MQEKRKAGFVAIVGRPNVGKSTLLNRIIGEKLAIVSDKPQTTRNRISGILNRGRSQMIFVDTPGLHRPRTHLGEYMVKQAADSIGDADCVVFVVEPRARLNQGDTDIAERIKSLGVPAILAINKTDTVKNEALLPVIAEYSRLADFEAVVPISAAEGTKVDELLDEIDALLPEGEWLYPDDELTDQTERSIASEMIREKMLLLLSDEVPHGIAVDIETMRTRDDPQREIIDIEATIYCEKESHKGIVIGKKGAMLKQIGSQARADMEEFFGRKVNLKLWVKVSDDWRNRDDRLKRLGFE